MIGNSLFNDEQFLEKLFSKQASVIRPGLERVSEAYTQLGMPSSQIPMILIGGTNGKGSTASVAAMCLQSASYRVGIYTSPHLLSFTERICVSGSKTSLEDLSLIYYEMEKKIAPDLWKALTFFEATTLLAFTYFERLACDVLVVEVGLGGRLDATNILSPLVSVVTSIDLDHTEWLGNTLQAIAKEKFGIARSGRPLIVSPEIAEQGLLESALECEAEIIFPKKRNLSNWILARPEVFQKNALLALEACEQLFARMKVNIKPAVPERLDFIPPSLAGRSLGIVFADKKIIADVSHNPAGVRAFLGSYQKKYGMTGVPVFVSVLADKDVAAILDEFAAFSGPLVFFRTSAMRGVKSSSELSLLWKGPIEWYDCFEDLWLHWQHKLKGDGAALLGGSFTAVASALEYFGAKNISDIDFDTMEYYAES